MAVAITAMKLENDLKLVEDDLGSFIQSQKNNLLREKLHLERNNTRKTDLANEGLPISSRTSKKNDTTTMPPVIVNNSNAARSTNDKTDQDGFNLGEYEYKQKKLRDERQNEYRQYLAQQSYMHGKRPIMINRPESQQNGHWSKDNEHRVENINGDRRRKEFKSNIDKEYGNLVKNKRNEETLYNHHHGMEDDSNNNNANAPRNGGRNKKIIEFDDSDDELFNYVLREKKAKDKERCTSGHIKTSRSRRRNNENTEDGRSSSVPLPFVPDIFNGHTDVTRNVKNHEYVHKHISGDAVNGNGGISRGKVPYIFGGSSHSMMRKEKNLEHKQALENQIMEKQALKISNGVNKDGVNKDKGISPTNHKTPYIFGGSSHTMVRKEKNVEYKHALEEQIKEKQAEKMREKLKRMGRITSDTDIDNKPKKDQINQYSEQNIAETSKEEPIPHHYQDSAENLAVGYPHQNNYPVNSMFNPMMNYPMGWPAYGPMVPNGFIPNNMIGFQQVPHEMPGQDMGTRVNRGYVPSAIDKSVNIHQSDTKTMPIDMNSKRLGQSNGHGNITENIPSSMKNDNQVKSSGQTSGGLVANIAIGESIQLPDVSTKRAQQVAYQLELKKQMEIKKAASEKERREREKYELKLEREIASYDPWGKSGCGAPVRNKDGKVVADLKKVLQSKDDGAVTASVDGNAIQDKPTEDLSPLLKALEMSENMKESTDDNESGNQTDTSPSYGRGAALKELQGVTMISPRDKKEQISYKQFLQQQVEEKKRKEEELKEKARLEEEKENRRLQEQQQKMREDYEQEKEKQRKKAEEVRKQNEALSRIAEQKKLDEELKRKKIEDERDAERRKEAIVKLTHNQESSKEPDLPPRSDSPPVPAVKKSSRRKSVDINLPHEPHNESKEAMEYLDTIRDSLKHNRDKEIKEHKKDVNEQKDLIRQLSALRKQLMRQELKVQSDLERNKKKYSNLLFDADWDEQPKVQKRSAFDRATRATSGHKRQPLKNFDGDNNNAHRDLDTQQQEYMQQQEMRLAALRQGVRSKTLPVQLQINRQASKQSLLDSDSKFISIDNHQEVKYSNRSAGDNFNGRKKRTENDNLSINQQDNVNIIDTVSLTTLQVEDISRKNTERLANLKKVKDESGKNKEQDDSDTESDSNVTQDLMVNQQYDAT